MSKGAHGRWRRVRRDAPFLFALGCIAAALFFNVVAARQCSIVYGLPERADSQQHPNPYNSDSPESPSAGKIPAASLANEPSQQGCLSGPFGIPSDGWIALFTLALFLATGALWWVTQQTLSHAEESGERELRAYVHIEHAHFVQGEGKVRIALKNFGATPAYKMANWGEAILRFSNNPPDFAPRPEDVRPATFPLAPGGVINADPVINDDRNFGPRLPGAILMLFVYGTIEYIDAFGIDRKTIYRLSSVFTGEGTLTAMPDGNDAT